MPKPFKELDTAAVVALVAKERAYAYTLRKAKDNAKATRAEYFNHISIRLEPVGFDNRFIEFEEDNGLHCHGIALLPSDFNFKRLRVRGWSIKVEELYDPLGWVHYCRKDKED